MTTNSNMTTVRIRLESLDWVEVPGIGFGAWVANEIRETLFDEHGEPIEPRGGWRVTHAASGASIASRADDLDRYDALRIARRLADEYPMPHVADIGDFSREDGHIVAAIVAEELAA